MRMWMTGKRTGQDRTGERKGEERGRTGEERAGIT
jgi:hypothetical protein